MDRLRTAELSESNPGWMLRPKPGRDVQIRLFCFPYAGGGASVFNSWPELIPSQVELWSVQLPGRENLRTLPAFTCIEPLLAALADAIEPYLDLPFAFYGHSMGALVSFELARTLRRQGRAMPKCLFVSGHRAPQLPVTNAALYALPQNEFLARVRNMGGTPDDVLDNRELMELFVPLLRADFEVCETYMYRDESPLECRISCFGGLDDSRVKREDLSAWRLQSAAPFRLRFFPGGHFFLHDAKALLLEALSRELLEVLRHLGRRVYSESH
jgi:medium-chain acyl-[acyl-carrier-protein] hydrolase